MELFILNLIKKTAFYVDALINIRKPKIGGKYKTIDTSFGKVCVYDNSNLEAEKTILMVPDGPCVIEHFLPLDETISKKYRVIIFDLPGFGFSNPKGKYNHRADQAVVVIREVYDSMGVDSAILNFTCVNGYYALEFAEKYPEDVSGIVLGQTPSVQDMRAWVSRVVPFPYRVPILGQVLNKLTNTMLIKAWFRIALPKKIDKAPWVNKSVENLERGGCNCFSGVVQGMSSFEGRVYQTRSIPIVAQWGLSDRSHTASNSYSIKQLVPLATVVELEDTGHFPNIENPTALLSALNLIQEELDNNFVKGSQ